VLENAHIINSLQNMMRNLAPRLVQLLVSSWPQHYLLACYLNVITRVKFMKMVIWFIPLSLASIAIASEARSLVRCKIAERRCKRMERIARPYHHRKENVVQLHMSVVS